MTIDEAIKYKKDLKRVLLHKGEVEYAEAEQLGIEALEIIQAYRKCLVTNLCCGLPGQTQD